MSRYGESVIRSRAVFDQIGELPDHAGPALAESVEAWEGLLAGAPYNAHDVPGLRAGFALFEALAAELRDSVVTASEMQADQHPERQLGIGLTFNIVAAMVGGYRAKMLDLVEKASSDE